jgi:hypothetical protein
MNLRDLATKTRYAAKGLKLPQPVKNRMNKAISDLVNGTYFQSIPLDKIDDILRKNGALLLQEDGTPWSGFLMGRDSRATIDIGDLESGRSENRPSTFYTPYGNTSFVISWYKMESGRFEITAYVS